MGGKRCIGWRLALAAAGGLAAEATAGAGYSASYPFTMKIGINTTAAGADVSGDVKGYPLAVILTAANFDFAQAGEKGEDLRFTGPDGKALPHEIESWDKAAKSAAIWVKSDIKGNSGAQSIHMHWGAGGIPAAGDGRAVFDAASGVLGAWHLSQDAGSEADGYRDASENGFHGTGVKLEKGSLAAGRIGKGTLLANPKGGTAGNVKWIEVAGDKVLEEFGADTHPITVSVWAYANTWGGYYETIFSRGDGEYSLQRDYQGKTEVCMSPQTPPHHQCALTSAPPTKAWTHYMILRTNAPYGSNKLALFLNGKQVTSTGSAGAHRKFPLGLGNQSQNGRTRAQRGFDGILDEARVYKVEKDANWAKLEYESQREGSRLLEFGQPTVAVLEPWLKAHRAETRFGALFDLRGRTLGRLAGGGKMPAGNRNAFVVVEAPSR